MASFDNDPALDLLDYYKIKAADALTATSFLLPVYSTYPQPHAPTPQNTHTQKQQQQKQENTTTTTTSKTVLEKPKDKGEGG